MSSGKFVAVWIKIGGELAVTNHLFVLKRQKLPLERGIVTIEDALQPSRRFRPGELRYLVLEIEGNKFTYGLLLAEPNLHKHLEVMKDVEKLIDYEFRPDGCLVLSRQAHPKLAEQT